MTNIVGIFSLDKGSGKTTTCAYLSAALAAVSKKVVSVDLNGDLSKILGTDLEQINVAGLAWKNYQGNALSTLTEDNEADFVLVDVPTELEKANEVLPYLNSVIIPVEAEFYGLEKLNETLAVIAEHKDLLISGFLWTKNSTCTPNEELDNYFSQFIYKSTISRNYYLALPEFSLSNLNGAGFHSGFIDYLKLANEIIDDEY